MSYNDNGFMFNAPPPGYKQPSYEQPNTNTTSYQKPANDGSSTFNMLTQQLLQLSNSLVPPDSGDSWSNDYQGRFQANSNQTTRGSSSDFWKPSPSQNNRSNSGNFGSALNDYQEQGSFQPNQNQTARGSTKGIWEPNQPQNNRLNSMLDNPSIFTSNNTNQHWPAAIPISDNDEFPVEKFKNRGGPYNKTTFGVGAHLLRKMGWRPGEGLGKDRTGPVQPLVMRGQTGLDKRGFSSRDEWAKKPKTVQQPKKAKSKNLKVEGKHPISVLCEYAMLQKWHLPQYIVKSESGEPHLKTFIFSVKINNIEYIMPDNTEHHVKKKAKEIVTRYCLQQLGIQMPN